MNAPSAEGPRRTRRYQVVLTRCDRHVIARIEELDIQVVATTMRGGVAAAREQALRQLARYGREGWAPDPVEKRVETIELPIGLESPVRPPNEGPLNAGSYAARFSDLASLTPREMDVLRQVSLGDSNAAIASTLHISVETVRTHVKHILRKLGVDTRRELIGIHTSLDTEKWSQ